MSTDPKKAGPKPPFPAPEQEPPGHEKDMKPQADHGEKSYQGSGKLKGRAALVTGGDSGIGRAVAVAFAREGADVFVSYLNEHDDAQETARLVAETGRKAVVAAGDLADEKHCQELVAQAYKAFGRLDILVNNAAHQMSLSSIQDLTAEELERTYRVNIFAMFHLCKAALPKMGKGGSVINTASIQGYQPSGELLAYASTKAAIINFTKGLCQEAMKGGVRVNAVAPGPVWTPLIPSTLDRAKAKTFGADTLFERPAQPAELAPLYVWLASDDASYVTGEVYAATGGKSPY